MRDDLVFVRHILDEVNYLLQATEKISYEQLLEDETLKRACIRSLEIIGEAAKNISSGFKEEHPLVEWREMAGLRDKLIHFYFGVDWEIVWDVVRNKIPALEKRLKGLLTEQS